MPTRPFTEEQVQETYDAYVRTGGNRAEMGRILDLSESSVRNRIAKMGIEEADLEIVESNVRLAKGRQKQQDLNRIERKAFREHARIENAVAGYAERLCELLEKHGLSAPRGLAPVEPSAAVGMIQLTDIHFNEVVRLSQNEYDFEISGKRLRKLNCAAIADFRSRGINRVLVAITGDLMNSDRRLDELLANQDNRARATLGAVDILRQFIDELVREGFHVTCADVNGNEGRVGKDIGWVAKVASDNYDETICRMLEYLYRGHDGVTWVENDDATECVVNVAGQNILLIHGHQLSAKDMEGSVGKLVSKWAKRGVIIRYTISGHIHSAYLNENFARSGSPVGDNAYSDKALNLTGRASGSYYVVEPDGSLHGFMCDTQTVDGIDGYVPLKQYQASCPKSALKAQGQGVTIFQVVV